MDILQAIILGIIQGFTEFLPISSSAHLVLTPWLFGWEDPGLAFNVALHIGTLIATVVFFRKDWVTITTRAYQAVSNWKERGTNDALLLFIIAATVPGVAAGYFLNGLAETLFRNPVLIAVMLAVFGALLFWSDQKAKQSKSIKDISFTDSLYVGLAQALAIIPGVSRSGVTITAGLLRGLDRTSAARFSFLLSAPVIFGAAIYESRMLFSQSFGLAEVVGIIASAISGFIAIKWLLYFVEKANYQVFFWYRLVLAIFIIGMVIFYQ